MYFLAFLAFIIILFYLYSLSSRIAALEKKIKTGETAEQLSPEKEQSLKSDIEQAPRAPKAPLSEPTIAEAPKPELDVVSWFSKIGIVALLFGMGFFLKYAIDQGWINEWSRIILGLVVGGLLILLGEFWKEKYTTYSRALTGGGLALLYFTVFAAFQFYGLISQSTGLIAEVLVTALAAGLSYRYKSIALGSLAVIGGFLSPILLYTGKNQQLELFIYLSILNLGIMFVLFKRFWSELLLLACLGTITDYVIWHSAFSSQQNTSRSMLFLVFSMILFFIVSAQAYRWSQRVTSFTKLSDRGLAYVLGIYGFFILFMTYFLLSPNVFREKLPIYALIEGLVILIAYLLINPANIKKINYGLTALFGLFIVLAIYWQYEKWHFDVALILLGLGSMIAGVFWRKLEYRTMGFAVLFLQLFWETFTPYESYNSFLINEKFIITSLSIISFWIVSVLYDKFNIQDHPFEKDMSKAARAIALVALWVVVSRDISESFRLQVEKGIGNLLISLWWIVYALSVAIYGGLTKQAIFRKLSALLFSLAIIKVFLYDVQALELGYRVVSFITLGVILLAVSFAYQKKKEEIKHFLEGDRGSISPDLEK